MRKSVRKFILVLFCFTALLSAQEKPQWLLQRPVNPGYFIGIGMSAKDSSATDYHQLAKDNALQDLASEIQVDISSEMLHNISEQSGLVEEDLRTQIRATTQASLEGFEMVDAWEDAETYWVYYRLSKDLYAKLKEERRVNAKYLAFDLLTKGRGQEKEPALALATYIQALSAIQEFLAEPLKVNFNGKQILIQNELFTSLQDLLSRIELRSLNARLAAVSGKSLEEPLKVFAFRRGKDSSEVGIANLPLEFKYVRGSGSLLNEIKTDQSGVGASIISKVGSGEKMQIITASVSVNALAKNPGILLKNILNNLNLPQTRFILTVSGTKVFVEAKESNLGQELEILQVEPKLKNALSEKGFVFSDDIAEADVLIELKAVSRKGAQVYNLYSAFADMTISVMDLRNGNEIYKRAFNNIKGIQLDFEKAGLTALQAAGKKVEQIVPEIIKPLQE